MARLPARCLLFACATLTACTAPAQPAAVKLALPAVKAEPTRVRAAPTRPAQLWPFTRLRGIDYVSVRDLAARFGLKPAWSKPDQAMTLGDAPGVRFTFENNQRDFYLDGLRVFLGEPVLIHRDSLWVSKLDVIKIVAPLFQPADHLAFLPAAPPRLIVLDPGHGGTDPGTENKKLGVNEKTFTLDVAFRLKKLLEAGGYRVLLTRDKDHRFSNSPAIDLPLRADFANKAGADLFVSIHFNNAPEAITGVETYAIPAQFMPSTADTKPDDLTAAALPGNRQDYANLLLGHQIHRAMRTGLKTPDRGYKRARWAVLCLLSCPGVLVECAYLSNDAEARRVATPEFRQQIAEALATGVQNYAATLAALRPAPPLANK
ncbi:MAG: N-acetylmuramoyl-L-alanine amidase [Lacunisphaera sp.]|nr:N-acetylmuramoyl-L-alanine amidase [Lacunisphaera sp.]